jgi:coproporphyrinogen III oxidase-like Fe-S oxidoreductase
LTPEEVLAEIPLLALRMRDGINWNTLCQQAKSMGLCHIAEEWMQKLLPFIRHGLLKWQDENLCLTDDGILVSNQVFGVFV